MSGFKTARPIATPTQAQGLFSTQEILRLMRIEFERAQRHKYALVCMKVGIDRLGALQDLYGLQSKEEILGSVVELVRSVTRDSDLLACLVDDRLVCMFPHTPPSGAALLAQRMLQGARGMGFDSDGRALRITLSIGIAHNQHPGSLSFETLMQVADEGLAVADAAGGDRVVETELYQLFERKRKLRTEEPSAPAREPQQILAARPVPAPLPSQPEDRRARTLSDKLYALIASQGMDLGGITEEDKILILKALQVMHGGMTAEIRRTAESEGDYKRQVEILERRLAKLTTQLGLTEEELKRIARMKNIDLGLHSIYRSVQGISDDESQAELKREMMSQIFEANVKLKMRIASEA